MASVHIAWWYLLDSGNFFASSLFHSVYGYKLKMKLEQEQRR